MQRVKNLAYLPKKRFPNDDAAFTYGAVSFDKVLPQFGIKTH